MRALKDCSGADGEGLTAIWAAVVAIYAITGLLMHIPNAAAVGAGWFFAPSVRFQIFPGGRIVREFFQKFICADRHFVYDDGLSICRLSS